MRNLSGYLVFAIFFSLSLSNCGEFKKKSPTKKVNGTQAGAAKDEATKNRVQVKKEKMNAKEERSWVAKAKQWSDLSEEQKEELQQTVLKAAANFDEFGFFLERCTREKLRLHDRAKSTFVEQSIYDELRNECIDEHIRNGAFVIVQHDIKTKKPAAIAHFKRWVEIKFPQNKHVFSTLSKLNREKEDQSHTGEPSDEWVTVNQDQDRIAANNFIFDLLTYLSTQKP